MVGKAGRQPRDFSENRRNLKKDRTTRAAYAVIAEHYTSIFNLLRLAWRANSTVTRLILLITKVIYISGKGRQGK